MKNLYFVLSIVLGLSASRAIGAESGMPQLNPEFWIAQILWLILIFSSLYIMIWKIFLPRIMDSVENRKSKIINDLNQTQKIKDNVEKKLSEYNKIIADAKNEAKKIIENNKKKLEADIEDKKKKFDKEIEKELSNVEKEIKDLKRSSISNINKIAEASASEIIKQIIGTDINASSVSAVVEDISKKRMEKNQ